MTAKKQVIKKGDRYWPSKAMKKNSVVPENVYNIAEKNPLLFWDLLARQGISWSKPWKKTYQEKIPYFKWFVGGKLNACYNCIDRHLEKNKDKKAIIWVPEPENEKPITLTYQQLYEKVNALAKVLLDLGIKKGDVVSIYLPMIPELIIAMLACARIGAIHSVVFSAFSSEALKTRIINGRAKLLITADGYYRRGKAVDLKESADKAVEGTKLKKILVIRRLNNKIKLGKKDTIYKETKKSCYVKPQEMDSEDPLFILYTSGTTGKPKGVIHTTGGYLTQAYWTAKWDFNLRENSLMWCTADIGWITGHTYACYGLLLNGITTLLFEGVMDYPNPDRIWKIVDKHKINVLYTAPTVIRMLMAYGDKWLESSNRNSLCILGTVGEPIDKAAWDWYFEKVGKKKCPIVDTWWQTETGSNMITAIAGIGPFIPCYAGKSFPGTKHSVLDDKGNICKPGKTGFLVQLSPFAPSMLRGIWRNKKRYKKTYWKQFKKVYLTGDYAFQSKEGFFRIAGRADDVLKVAGHRLSTAEIENILNLHKDVNESAIVAKPDKIRGEVPVAFIIKEKRAVQPEPEIQEQLQQLVREKISPIAKIEKFYFVKELPKTRSGKIMRRVLKTLLIGENLKDLSTLINPESIKEIKRVLKLWK